MIYLITVNKPGEAYCSARPYCEALEQLNKTLELDPNFKTAIKTKS
jgi:hypothetical protein